VFLEILSVLDSPHRHALEALAVASPRVVELAHDTPQLTQTKLPAPLPLSAARSGCYSPFGFFGVVLYALAMAARARTLSPPLTRSPIADLTL